MEKFQVVGTNNYRYALIIGVISYQTETGTTINIPIPKEEYSHIGSFHGFLVEAEELEAVVQRHPDVFNELDSLDPSKIYHAIKSFVSHAPVASFDPLAGKLTFSVSTNEEISEIAINGIAVEGLVSIPEEAS